MLTDNLSLALFSPRSAIEHAMGVATLNIAHPITISENPTDSETTNPTTLKKSMKFISKKLIADQDSFVTTHAINQPHNPTHAMHTNLIVDGAQAPMARAACHCA